MRQALACSGGKLGTQEQRLGILGWAEGIWGMLRVFLRLVPRGLTAGPRGMGRWSREET